MVHLLAVICLCALLISMLPMSGISAAEQTPPDDGIAAALQPFVDRQVLAGAVTVVASKDKILSEVAVGYADIAGKKPMQVDSLFWIASQTKPITGTALMMLVEEGKLKIEDPVEKYLPEFKGIMVITEKDEHHTLLRPPGHLITVEEIMCHTAGMEFKSPVEEPTLDLLPLRLAVRANAAMPLQYEPGTKYQYSNAGINAAGRIIEVLSGMSYEEFLQKRLFDPLGMKDTTFWPNDEQVQRLAKSYTTDKDKTILKESTVTQLKYPLTDHVHRYPFPAGGLFSTARDCGTFCRMILNGGELDGKRYLSEASVKIMTSRHTPEALKDSYGLGWAVGSDWCGHGGAYATNMQINRSQGLIYVFLVQHAGFPGDGGKSQEVFKHAALEKYKK